MADKTLPCVQCGELCRVEPAWGIVDATICATCTRRLVSDRIAASERPTEPPITPSDRVAAIDQALRELACSDHSCCISKPRGMGTNGGCHCVDELQNYQINHVLQLRQVQVRQLKLDLKSLTRISNQDSARMHAKLEVLMAENERLRKGER